MKPLSIIVVATDNQLFLLFNRIRKNPKKASSGWFSIRLTSRGVRYQETRSSSSSSPPPTRRAPRRRPQTVSIRFKATVKS